MPSLLSLFRIFSISRVFKKKKTRRAAFAMKQNSKASIGKVSEKFIPGASIGAVVTQEPPSHAPAKTTILMEPLSEASTSRPILRRCASEPNLRRQFCEGSITTPSLNGPLSETLIENPIPKQHQAEASVGKTIARKSVTEVPIEIHIPEERHPGTSIGTKTRSTKMTKRKGQRATAQNNRLLALPAELRMQIYDELLAIPRTVYMLEPEKYVKSHLHKIKRFDKELFTRRGLLRYKFSAPCVGYYDPRTTTFAARFSDDDDCRHCIWSSENPGATHGVPTSARQISSPVDTTNQPGTGVYLVFPVCSPAIHRTNQLTWGRIHEQLCDGPEIHMLELEFPKICSLITVLKYLILGRLPGWRELRKLSVLRIRLRSGNGGPLNIWEMVVLWSVTLQWQKEMQRMVSLRRGPRIEMAW